MSSTSLTHPKVRHGLQLHAARVRRQQHDAWADDSVYMGGRYYSLTVGRMLSVDPQEADPSDLHSLNRYAYGNNNPYRHVDPDGRSPVDIAFLVADVGRLGVAIYNGAGVGKAAVDVGLSVVGVLSPVPGTGQALKLLRVAEAGVKAVKAADRIVVLSEAGDAGNATQGAQPPVGKEPPVPGATPGDKTKGRTTQWENDGSMDEANRDFDAKGPKDVVPLPDGGRRGTLPDGRQINVRPDSTDGRPTLEIQNGKSRDKVRYNP